VALQVAKKIQKKEEKCTARRRNPGKKIWKISTCGATGPEEKELQGNCGAAGRKQWKKKRRTASRSERKRANDFDLRRRTQLSTPVLGLLTIVCATQGGPKKRAHYQSFAQRAGKVRPACDRSCGR